jgi:hypothetical protein
MTGIQTDRQTGQSAPARVHLASLETRDRAAGEPSPDGKPPRRQLPFGSEPTDQLAELDQHLVHVVQARGQLRRHASPSRADAGWSRITRARARFDRSNASPLVLGRSSSCWLLMARGTVSGMADATPREATSADVQGALLTTEELAARYRVDPSTIRDWRSRQYGPRPTPIGRRMMYRMPAVLAWEAAQEAAAAALRS